MINKKIFIIVGVLLLITGVVYASGIIFFGEESNQGLVAHYPLDGDNYNPSTGKVTDKTPYSNDGTNNGATLTTDKFGHANKSMNFDGVDDYINIPSSNSLNPGSNNFSVEVWFKMNSVGTIDAAILYNKESLYEASAGGGYFTYAWQPNWAWFGGTSFPVNVGEWYHAVVVYDGINQKLFKNGNLVYSRAQTGIIGTNTNDLRIGARGAPNAANSFANASISEVRVYNRALSENEIKSLYDSYKPKVSTSDLNKGLVGHWMLDSENEAKDKTPYSNHGTANGEITIGGTTDRKGKTGGATSFDGTDDYIKLPNELISNSYIRSHGVTYTIWVKSFNTTVHQNIFGQKPDSGYSDFASGGLGLENDRARMIAYDDNVAYKYAIGNTVLEDDVWYLLVGTYDPSDSKIRIYVNGILDGIPVSITTFNRLVKNNENTIGKQVAGSSYFFKGNLSEARIYNRALSEDEIKYLYNSYNPKLSSGSLQKGLVLDMPLTSNYMKSNTIVTDKTPYSNDGTIKNNAVIGVNGTIFDGSTQYIDEIENPNFIEPESITVSGWINMDTNAPTARNIWLTKWYGYSMEITDTTRIPYFRLYGPGDTNSNVSLTLGIWHHFIGTYDPSIGARVYLDGVLVGSKAPNGAITYSRSYPLNIGRYSGGVYFDGQISNVKIWNRALSEEEIKLLYSRGRN